MSRSRVPHGLMVASIALGAAAAAPAPDPAPDVARLRVAELSHVAADELGVSENPVRSGRVYFTWEPGVGDGRLSVYTLTGFLVYRTAVSSADGRAEWDLTDLDGRPVGNGAYAVIVEFGERVLRRRLFVQRDS